MSAAAQSVRSSWRNSDQVRLRVPDERRLGVDPRRAHLAPRRVAGEGTPRSRQRLSLLLPAPCAACFTTIGTAISATPEDPSRHGRPPSVATGVPAREAGQTRQVRGAGPAKSLTSCPRASSRPSWRSPWSPRSRRRPAAPPSGRRPSPSPGCWPSASHGPAVRALQRELRSRGIRGRRGRPLRPRAPGAPWPASRSASGCASTAWSTGRCCGGSASRCATCPARPPPAARPRAGCGSAPTGRRCARSSATLRARRLRRGRGRRLRPPDARRGARRPAPHWACAARASPSRRLVRRLPGAPGRPRHAAGTRCGRRATARGCAGSRSPCSARASTSAWTASSARDTRRAVARMQRRLGLRGDRARRRRSCCERIGARRAQPAPGVPGAGPALVLRRLRRAPPPGARTRATTSSPPQGVPVVAVANGSIERMTRRRARPRRHLDLAARRRRHRLLLRPPEPHRAGPGAAARGCAPGR